MNHTQSCPLASMYPQMCTLTHINMYTHAHTNAHAHTHTQSKRSKFNRHIWEKKFIGRGRNTAPGEFVEDTECLG